MKRSDKIQGSERQHYKRNEQALKHSRIHKAGIKTELYGDCANIKVAYN
jgi:hypothetical protein